jgi:NTE family protein
VRPEAPREDVGVNKLPGQDAEEPELGSRKDLPNTKRDGVALCLSGGGYRAALFHLGALRRLNELRALSHVDTFSSVSGGSIVSALLLDQVPLWPEKGEVIDPWQFQVGFTERLRRLTRKNIRTLWIFRRLIAPGDSSVAVRALQRRYAKEFEDRPLASLPRKPRFVFSATDMSFGVNWVSERERVGDYQAGYAEPPPHWTLARAVAASSCFPPVFDPMPIELGPEDLKGGHAEKHPSREELINKLRLTDGGVYDNMGLEPVWKGHAKVLVSDGGATFDFAPDQGLLRRLARYLTVQGNQAGAVRKRWLIANFEEDVMDGTYWGIGSSRASYGLEGGYSEAFVDEVISEIRTDLDYFTPTERGVLENHGYDLADAAIQTHQPDLAAEVPFARPHPQFEIEADLRHELGTSYKRRLFGRWRRWPPYRFRG